MSHLHCGRMDFAHQSGKTGLPFGHCRSRTPPVHPVVICVHQIVTACIVGPPNMAPFPDARRYTGHEGHTARGSALHHTAVLLTRQGEAAEDFVQIALAKAWQSWGRIDGNHEAYVRRMMVNEFASAWRRRGAASCPPALPGRALSVPMTCTPSGNPKGNLILINDWFTRMVANFTGPGRTGIAMCAITGGHFCEPIGVATDTNTTVAADVSLTTGSGPSLAPPRPRRFMRLSTRACPGEAIPAHHAPQARTPPSGRVRWPFRTWVRQRRANANQALAASCPYDPKRNLNLEVAGLAVAGAHRRHQRQRQDGAAAGVRRPHQLLGLQRGRRHLPARPRHRSSPRRRCRPVGQAGAKVPSVIILQDFTSPDWPVTHQPRVG